MKKSGTVGTVIFTVILVLLILSFSLLIYVRNNTASVVNRIIEYRRGKDSPWSFSFENIETGYDEKVTVRGFTLFYEDMLLVRLDSVTASSGVMGLWNFWKNEDSAISVNVKGGRINLTNAIRAYRDYEGKPHSGGFSFYDFIRERTAVVTGEDITVGYDYFSGTADTISLSYNSSDRVFCGAFTSKSIAVICSDYRGNLINAHLNFINDEDIIVKAEADKLHLSGSDVSAEFGRLSFSESTPSIQAFLSNDYFGTLRSGKGEIETEQGRLSFTSSEFDYSDETVTGTLDNTSVTVDDITAFTDALSLSMDTSASFTLSSDDIRVSNGSSVCTAGKTEIEGKLDGSKATLKTVNLKGDMREITGGRIAFSEFSSVSSVIDFTDSVILSASAESFTADVPELVSSVTGENISALFDDGKIILFAGSISSDISSLTEGRIGRIVFSSLGAELERGDEELLSFSFDASASTPDEDMGDISFSAEGKITASDDSFPAGRIEINNLYPGFGSTITRPLVIESNSDEEASVTLESDSVSLDLRVSAEEKRVKGALIFSDLPLKNALEFVLAGEYGNISGESLINLTSDIDLTLDGIDRTRGNISFAFDITSIRVKIFSFDVSSAGTVFIQDGIVTLDGVTFTTPLFSFGVGGYYDLVTRMPHFQFHKMKITE